MKGLRFERRGEGNYYKLILHVGPSYVPISDDIIEVLRQGTALTPDRFLSLLLDNVGYSTYLKNQIQTELTNGGDTATQLATLQKFLKEL